MAETETHNQQMLPTSFLGGRSCCSAARKKTQETMSRIALINARMIDGTGRLRVAPATIVVGGSVLHAAGPANEVCVSEDARRFDVQGRPVLPL